MQKFLMIFVFALLISGGCSSKSKKDGDTFAKALNGENYERADMISVVPVVERKGVTKMISGYVYCGQGIARVPANHASVSLLQENTSVKTVMTASNGYFEMKAPYDSKGQ